ncbi:ArsR/SmtB family transcription factor [Kitasatospora viridis]|uniref:Regulatory ArsR family protein n=1 Tax=Kitasatospora viridis TaxID=281105 RepID=A0A561UQF7_9ACTN|nr:ArsR family transcriptional regulator [Kitasatospora viridis]TWG01581.1 regulatory ArsR family protein [Kitasatospora viridis]
MPAELAFSTDDLARVRFAVSPLWQLTTSYRLLLRGAGPDHPVHGRWIAQVRPRAAVGDGLLGELLSHPGYAPDFLNPDPAGPSPSLEQELAALTATPAERVRADLEHLGRHRGGLGPRSRALAAEPAGGLARLAEELAAYFGTALAPYWARIRAVLDADVLYRARRAAEHGTGTVLDELHESMSWDAAGALRLRGRKQPIDRPAVGPGVVLLPLAFGADRLRSRVAPPDPPQLAYPARGTGTLWLPRPGTGHAALAAVLGRSRTRLLAELDLPASTTDLAARTGLSPAAVSKYLIALRDAGLTTAHRAGRSVLYARTATGEAVLATSAG